MSAGYAISAADALSLACTPSVSDTDALDAMAVLTINSDGIICRCNQAASRLLNCNPSKIVWQYISMILPQLTDVPLMQAEHINPNLRFLSRIGHHFEVMTFDGRRFESKLYFNHIEDFGRHCLRLIIRPVNLPDE